MGGLFTGLIGIMMQPWKFVADPNSYIITWLVAYSALLGSVGGVLIADYFVIRRTKLDLAGLYQKDGPYWYVGGFNRWALVALALGIAPCIPGFLATVLVDFREAIPTFWVNLYHYAWFISFTVSFMVYVVLMKSTSKAR
jgi:NCS1 family nucleobase:cation symporter-1